MIDKMPYNPINKMAGCNITCIEVSYSVYCLGFDFKMYSTAESLWYR